MGTTDTPTTAASSSSLVSDSAGRGAEDVALMVPTLHHAGVATAGLSTDGIRAAYRELQDRQAKDRAEAEARAQEQRRRDLDEQRRQMQAEAERQRADRATRARRFLDERLTDHRGMTDDQAIETAAGIWRESERQAAREGEERQRRQKADLLFRAADCPARHVLHLDQFHPEHDNPAMAQVFDTLCRRVGTGYLVALLGPRGTGKTQLAIALIRAACDAGRSGRYVKRLDLSRIIRRTFTTPTGRGQAVATEADVVDELVGVDLLVIDEVHQAGDSDFDNNLLTNLLDRRYDAMRSTLLISNQTREEFGQTVGPSVVSRIHEAGEAIVCNWTTYRRPGMWREAGAA